MDVSGLDGLNDTPLLAPVLRVITLPTFRGATGKTRVNKKWLLQEDGVISCSRGETSPSICKFDDTQLE
jgi:hypothetical protein